MSARDVKHRSTNTDTVLIGVEVSNEDLPVERLKERNVKHIRLSSSRQLTDIYKFGEEIGRGNFGTVISVQEKSTEREWAMKIINKSTAGTKIKLVQQEIHILKMIEHPHIIRLEKVYETTKKIYLIMEKCLEELARRLNQNNPFPERDVKKVISEIVSAVVYLHKYDIVHRDLKLENILLAQNPQDPSDNLYIKITDFGLSAVKLGSRPQDFFHECCGTLVYMSPEMITNTTYSQQCDIWSIGIIAYVLLAGRFPFYGKSEKEVSTKICKDEPDFGQIKASPEAKDIISKTLEKNPAVRITAVEMIEHPWMKGEVITYDNSPNNVLDMMRMWKSQMMVPITGEESDWLAVDTSSLVSNLDHMADSGTILPSTSSRRISVHRRADSQESSSSREIEVIDRSSKRHIIPMAVKNIKFDRSKGIKAGRRGKVREQPATSQGNKSESNETKGKGASSARRKSHILETDSSNIKQQYNDDNAR